MYDVATQTVSRLSGELSSAFVEAAEANSFGDEDKKDTKAAASSLVETRVLYDGANRNSVPSDVEFEDSASDFVESKVPIIDPIQGDLESEASEHLESFVDVSGMPVDIEDDLTASGSSDSVRGV